MYADIDQLYRLFKVFSISSFLFYLKSRRLFKKSAVFSHFLLTLISSILLKSELSVFNILFTLSFMISKNDTIFCFTSRISTFYQQCMLNYAETDILTFQCFHSIIILVNSEV